jgi:elongation factor Ts
VKNILSTTSIMIRNLALRRMASAASPALVKQLRLLTGSPLKDCMKALEETNGDIEASKDYLRKKGLAEAEKKIDRLAAQGLVGVLKCPNSNKITMIQLACETDFVAKTDKFQEGLRGIMQTFHA